MALREICDELIQEREIGILNVTDGNDLWLVGIAGNQLCVDEGFLVNHPPKQPIDKIVLVERSVAQELWKSHSDWADASKTLIDSVIQSHVSPSISKEAKIALQDSSLIVYGSGTLHSSLLPSYLTENLCTEISKNTEARKILFANGERDLDFADNENQVSLLNKTITALGATDIRPIMTDIFICNLWPQDNSLLEIMDNPQFIDVNILRGSLNVNNRYSENDAYLAFSSVVSELSGHILSPSESVISLVAPTYNEASRLPSFLSGFIPYVFNSSWACEKILIDGGSKDQTLSILRSSDSYSLLTLEQNENRGRFSAISKGISAARGKFVVVFHSDAEYDISNLDTLINAITTNPQALIVGSRTTTSYGATGLRHVYGENGTLFWLSRIGGVLVAGIVSLRLGRPISDPFCGILAGGRNLMQDIIPLSGDLDAQIKIFYECKKRGITVIEVPLQFVPRSKAEGKKTNFRMGVKAILASFLYKPKGKSDR